MTYLSVITLLSFLLFVHCFAQENVGYDRDALQRLTEYRQRHRRTLNGELCAAAFVQDGQTYTDCTAARAPDGTIGREWCYVEYQNSRETGNYWNFCAEVINYDTVRAKAREVFELKGRDMQSAAVEVRNQAGRLQEVLQRYSQVCSAGHEVAPARIDAIKKSINAGEHTTSKLEHIMSQVNFLETTLGAVKEDIKKDRIAASQDRTNCEAIPGYEDDPVADGLRGSYFNNARFEGVPTAYKDDAFIDFVWDEISPAANIPIHHFSVRWDGHVMAPETGNYVFSTSADCGVRLFLDGSAIIVDRMPAPMEGDALTEGPVNVVPPLKSTGILKAYSAPQPLIGGQKYRIRVEYFHLSTLKWSSPHVATIKLSWKLDTMDEQIIPREQFFKSNPKKSLKISGLPGKFFNLGILEDGAHAFVDFNVHFISDVPLRYEGAKLVRTVYNPKFDKFHLRVSAPCMFYVAAPRSAGNPISSSDQQKYPLAFTGGIDSITVLKSKSKKKIASEQSSLSVYGAQLEGGSMNLNVRPGTSFFMFFVPSKVTEGKCGGETTAVSRTDSELFDDCTSSSYAAERFNCKAGLSGINQDTDFGVWRTSGGTGVNQYISVTFTKTVEIKALQFKTRSDPQTWPRQVELRFGGTSDSEKINIVPGDHTYQLKVPRATTSAKLVVTHMRDDSRPSDTGGSVAFIGVPCEPVREVPTEKEEDTHNIAISFRGGTAGFPPDGYKLDDGSPKAQHGKLVYGWDHSAKAVNVANCEDIVFLRDTSAGGIQFPPTVESDDECLTGEKDCARNTWSIDLPHYGVYRVTVEVGSPCGGEQKNSLQVNGIPFVENEILRGGEYTKAIGDVKLYLTPTLTLTSKTATTIQSIRIEKIVHK